MCAYDNICIGCLAVANGILTPRRYAVTVDRGA